MCLFLPSKAGKVPFRFRRTHTVVPPHAYRPRTARVIRIRRTHVQASHSCVICLPVTRESPSRHGLLRIFI